MKKTKAELREIYGHLANNRDLIATCAWKQGNSGDKLDDEKVVEDIKNNSDIFKDKILEALDQI